MVALLLGGTIVLCAGLLAVVFGIPIKEFSFGNTMILAGAVVACTGVMLIGLSFVVRELKNLAHRLNENALAGPGIGATGVGARAAADASRSRTEPAQPKAVRAAPRNSGKQDVLFSRDELHDSDFADEVDHLPPAPSLSPGSAPAWPEESDLRARPAPPQRPAERISEAGDRARRDILFSSTRRDQQNGAASDYDREPPAGAPDPFASGWPGLDPEPPRNGRAPRNGTSRPQSSRRHEASSVTVVKSGVVDAMAYSLYSDGSIEAQMPEGMVRFESIEELRAHLDQRG
ncbi:MAG: hypothetical protein K2X60_12990 [Xanthobacteraceae bacterium]|nr:hypothetical protein [Xanthobacteraceae bacterium]